MSLHVFLPGSGRELIRKELELAFLSAGCRVTNIDPAVLGDAKASEFLADTAGGGPSLVLSVNFQGLERLKTTLGLLERISAGRPERERTRLAVWCVDNPWNLLSGQRDPAWRGLPLFVTDKSFIAPLQAHGARMAYHLPLAASAELFAPNARRDAAFAPPADLAPLVFVGRSAFPGKDRFFAGLRIPDDRIRTARAMLGKGERPDLFWWERHLGQGPFWPGKRARLCALGAEESNLCWRALCLARAAGAAGANPGLDVFGDRGWRGMLPAGARLHPPVDYYARLPGIYASARYSLALTSLQLPHGLTQRHFDIWAAGGFCLTDNTPGLDLFPADLTRPITFRRPGDLAATVEDLEGMPGRESLRRDWQTLILERHSYALRVRELLRLLEEGRAS